MNHHLINHSRCEISASLMNVLNSKLYLNFSVQVEIEEIFRKVNLDYTNMLKFCESNIRVCRRDQKLSFINDENKILENQKSNCESDIILSKNPTEVVEKETKNNVEGFESQKKV